MNSSTAVPIYCSHCATELTGRACLHEVGTGRRFCNDSCYRASDKKQAATGEQWKWEQIGLPKKSKKERYGIKK